MEDKNLLQGTDLETDLLNELGSHMKKKKLQKEKMLLKK